MGLLAGSDATPRETTSTRLFSGSTKTSIAAAVAVAWVAGVLSAAVFWRRRSRARACWRWPIAVAPSLSLRVTSSGNLSTAWRNASIPDETNELPAIGERLGRAEYGLNDDPMAPDIVEDGADLLRRGILGIDEERAEERLEERRIWGRAGQLRDELAEREARRVLAPDLDVRGRSVDRVVALATPQD